MLECLCTCCHCVQLMSTDGGWDFLGECQFVCIHHILLSKTARLPSSYKINTPPIDYFYSVITKCDVTKIVFNKSYNVRLEFSSWFTWRGDSCDDALWIPSPPPLSAYVILSYHPNTLYTRHHVIKQFLCCQGTKWVSVYHRLHVVQ